LIFAENGKTLDSGPPKNEGENTEKTQFGEQKRQKTWESAIKTVEFSTFRRVATCRNVRVLWSVLTHLCAKLHVFSIPFEFLPFRFWSFSRSPFKILFVDFAAKASKITFFELLRALPVWAKILRGTPNAKFAEPTAQPSRINFSPLRLPVIHTSAKHLPV
jgi:hypothetical protein